MPDACSVPSTLSKNRVEALTDGIFAIAMTLLVLGIVVPHETAVPQVIEFLEGQLEELVEFSTAFLALAAFWVLQHQQFHYIRVIDQKILVLSIGSLFCVSLVPFTTSLEDVYQGSQVAEIIIGLNFLILGSIYLLQWIYASKNRCLMVADLPAGIVASEVRRNLIVPAVSAAGILLSLSGVKLGLVIYFVIPFLFLVFPLFERYRPRSGS